MDESNNPEIDDIDAFLSADATSARERAVRDDLQRQNQSSGCNKDPVQESDPIKRLDNRVSHATRSLSGALLATRSTAHAIAQVADDNEAMRVDIDAWEATLDNCDIALKNFRPKRSKHASSLSQEDISAGEAQSNNLLDKLLAQEARIHELEARLAKLGRPVHEEQVTPANQAGNTGANSPYVNRILVTLNGNENLKFPLTRNIMTIGRDPGNDIQIRSRYVSRHHARIVCDAHGAVIEDAGSRNGVNVNAQRITRHPLRSGDLIDLGRFQLKYIDLMEGSASEGRA